MSAAPIDIALRAKDNASAPVVAALRKIEGQASSVANTLKGLAGAAAAGLSVYGITELAKSFVDASREAENYKTRLKVITGSTEEAGRVFKAAADYAAQVPFEFRNIMGAATQLAGVTDGTADGVMKWLPMIGDLAATTGLTIEETTGQVVRMMSAGAASADLFRERGVLAMLGFQAGVTYSAEETKKKLIAAYTDPASKFKGATEELAKTLTGQLSMASDAWFKLSMNIGDNLAQTAEFKAVLATITATIDDFATSLQNSGNAGELTGKGFETLLTVVEGIAQSFNLARVGLSEFNVVLFTGIKAYNEYMLLNEKAKLSLSEFTNIGGIEDEHIKEHKAAIDKYAASAAAADTVLKNNYNTVISQAGAFETIHGSIQKARDTYSSFRSEFAKKLNDDLLLQFSAPPPGWNKPASNTGGLGPIAPPLPAAYTEPDAHIAVFQARRDAAWATQEIEIQAANDTSAEQARLDAEADARAKAKYDFAVNAASAARDRQVEILAEMNEAERISSENAGNYWTDSLAAATSYYDAVGASMQIWAEQNAVTVQTVAQQTVDFLSTSADAAASIGTRAIMQQQSLAKFGADLLRTIAAQAIQGFLRTTMQYIVNSLIQTKAAMTETAVKVAGYGATTYASAFASTVGFLTPVGAAGYAAAAVAAMNAGAAASYAETLGMMQGVTAIAHGGLENVPSEGTYFLNKGERVLAPKQNRDLEDFLDGKESKGSGGTPSTFIFQIDGREFGRMFGDLMQDGRIPVRLVTA